MKYFCEMVRSSGEPGTKREQFDTLQVREVEPGAIHPEPSPLFDTADLALADGQARYPEFLASEIERLSETGDNQYRVSRGLQNYHEFIKAQAAELGISTATAADRAAAARVKANDAAGRLSSVDDRAAAQRVLDADIAAPDRTREGVAAEGVAAETARADDGGRAARAARARGGR